MAESKMKMKNYSIGEKMPRPRKEGKVRNFSARIGDLHLDRMEILMKENGIGNRSEFLRRLVDEDYRRMMGKRGED